MLRAEEFLMPACVCHVSSVGKLWSALRSIAACIIFVVLSLSAHAQSTAQTAAIGTTNGAFSILMQASDGYLYGLTIGNYPVCASEGAAAGGQCGNLYQVFVASGLNGVNTATPFNEVSFQNQAMGTSGFFPANLLEDPQSILYGATGYGGAGGSTTCNGYDSACGTFFQFFYDPDVVRPTAGANFSVLHNFTSAENGQGGPITLGSDGNYYGVTIAADNGFYPSAPDTFYKLTPSGDFTELVDFKYLQHTVGLVPNQLVEGDDGYFYGTTREDDYCGVVYKMDKTGATTILENMPADGSMGCQPVGQLVEGPDGAFYGITTNYDPSDLVVIFRVTKTGAYTVLHTLTAAEGTSINTGLVLGSDGVLYGIAGEGGGAAACSYTGGCGTVFSITTSGTFNVLYTFPGGQAGAYPGALMQMSSSNAALGGTLIGSAGGDGKTGDPAGVIFQVTLPAGHQASPVQIQLFKQSDKSPITSASQIDPNTPLILDWQVLNAYSNTMQQCYARAHNPVNFDGDPNWTGKQVGTLSSVGYTGSAVVTPQYAGAYTYSLTCGGTESTIVNLTIQNTLNITTATLSDGTVGKNYSVTLAASGGTAPYTWSVAEGALPPGLTLEGPNGVLSGKPTQYGSYTFTIQAKDNSVTPEVVTAVLTMNVNAGLAVNPTALPQGVVGTSYSQAISVTGGIAPYTLTIPANTLPDGLTFTAATGTISGTPIKVGTWNITVSIADSENRQATTTQSYSIRVVSTPLTIDAVTLPKAGVSQQFAQQLAATGGVTPYTWSVTSGTPPQGLQLSTAGLLSGTPLQYSAGSPFTIQVTDSETPPQTATVTFTLPVQNTLTITSTTLPAATVGIQYSAPVVATGGVPPYSWVAGANLDKLGLAINAATGVISGIPQVAGAFSGGVSVTDSEGTPANTTTEIVIPINPAGIAVSSTTLTTSNASAAVGQSVTFTATVSVPGGTPTGIITFVAGTTTLGTATLNSSGVATLTTSFSSTGVYNVVASYNGDAYDEASASTAVVETVVAPTLSAAINPDSITISRGASGTLTITLTPVGSYIGTVSFSCGTLPTDVSCTFAPPSITLTAGGSVQTDTLTINTATTKSALLSSPINSSGSAQLSLASALWLPGSLVALSGIFRRRQKHSFTRRFWLIGILCLGFVSVGQLCGCGGNTSKDARLGTYTIPVTLTVASGGTQTVNATIVVK
jgi:hypothetical protein